MPVQPIKTERSSTTIYRVVIAILVIALLVLFFSPSALTAGEKKITADKSRAEENVRELYKVISGSDTEVLKTVEQNGLYKVTVRFRDATGRDTLQDVFVTTDGMFFTDRLIDLQLQKSVLANQSAFAQCLADKKIAIFGLLNDASTQAQLQILGAFSGRLYVDCGGQNSAICQQLNITESLPVIFYNGTLIQGPQNLNWFEQNAGCALQ